MTRDSLPPHEAVWRDAKARMAAEASAWGAKFESAVRSTRLEGEMPSRAVDTGIKGAQAKTPVLWEGQVGEGDGPMRTVRLVGRRDDFDAQVKQDDGTWQYDNRFLMWHALQAQRQQIDGGKPTKGEQLVARREREAFRRYLRRKQREYVRVEDGGEPYMVRAADEAAKHLTWVLAREKRYSRAPGGLSGRQGGTKKGAS